MEKQERPNHMASTIDFRGKRKIYGHETRLSIRGDQGSKVRNLRNGIQHRPAGQQLRKNSRFYAGVGGVHQV
jgi:hypothetical protein